MAKTFSLHLLRSGLIGRQQYIFGQGHKAVCARVSAPEGRGLIGYSEMAKENHV
jgi:hypothetical protein